MSEQTDAPRYHYVDLSGRLGILDNDNPDIWAEFPAPDWTPEEVKADADALNAGADPNEWHWKPLPLDGDADEPLSARLDRLTDRLLAPGTRRISHDDYSLLLDISDYLHSIDA